MQILSTVQIKTPNGPRMRVTEYQNVKGEHWFELDQVSDRGQVLATSYRWLRKDLGVVAETLAWIARGQVDD